MWKSLVTLLILSASPTFSQDTTSIPPRPPGGISDDALIFDDDGRASLESEIARYRDATGTRLFVASYRIILGDSPSRMATRLHSSWADAPEDVVILYLRATRQFTLITAALPEEDLRTVLDTAEKAASGELPNDVADHPGRVQRFVTTVAAEIGSRTATPPVAIQAAETPPASGLPLNLPVFIGTTILASGVGILVWILLQGGHPKKRGEEASPKKMGGSYQFPDIKVGQRLGAPYGGGVIAQIRFKDGQ